MASNLVWVIWLTGCGSAADAPGTQVAGAMSAPAGGSSAAGSRADAGASNAAGTSGIAAPVEPGMRASQAGNVAPHAGAPASDDDAGSPNKPTTNTVATDFSDDFENDATLDPDRYEIAMPSCSGTGTVALDSTDAHSGKHAVRVNGSAGYCNHVFFSPKGLPSPLSDPLYVRVFVKLQSALGAGHVTFVALHDAHDNHDLRVGGQSQILMWNRESDDATLPELSPAGIALSVAPAAGTWHCLEFAIGGQMPSIQTWFDGNAVVGLTVDAQPTPDVDQQWSRDASWRPQLTDVRFGWESYADQANTLWFDDVAIGKTRIGCDYNDSPISNSDRAK